MAKVMRIKEAAAYLAMGPKKLRELAHKGEIPYISLGDNTSPFLFLQEDLDKFLLSRRIGGAASRKY